MAEQLILNLPTRTALDRGDFFVSNCNEMAMAILEDWPNWTGRKLVLWGPKGAGKTHLAHVWAELTDARFISARDLDKMAIDELAQSSVVVDDADQVITSPAHQQALFHLHNLVLANGHYLLLTGRHAPQHWNLPLADLQSRVMAAGCAELHNPDDTLFLALLAKLFGDRQLFPAPDVLHYLVTRLDRSFDAAQFAVQVIDDRALSQKRAISRPFVATILDEISVA